MSLPADLRHATRGLLRAPGFSATAVLVLALGIGANTAIFSLMDAVLLRPLPAVGAPAELFDLKGDTVSYPLYRALAEGTRGAATVAAGSLRSMSLTTSGEPQIVGGGVVSANYFDVLRASPALGRFFRAAEEESGDAVVVLGQGLWKARLGADASVVGKTVRLNGIPFTVVGVAPEGFRGAQFGSYPDLWVTIGAMPRLATGELARLDIHSRNWGWLRVFGRLNSGVSPRRAQAALVASLQRDANAHGEAFDPSAWRTVPTLRAAAGFGSEPSPGRLFEILASAVIAALLIACANLANLLLARAASRGREIAIRRALGASRGRLVRQMLTESLLLALAGGAAGLVAASWALSALAELPLPGGLTLAVFRPELGVRAAIFALAVSALTGIAFGLLPALQASRTPIDSALRSTASTLAPRSAARGIFLGAQVALCLALLACAGLLGRSLANALAIDVGFRPAGVTLAGVNLGLQRYDAGRAAAFLEELPRRLAGRPGVVSVSWTGIVPLSGEEAVETFQAEGYTPAKGERPSVDVAVVGAGYFRTLAIPMAAGRTFQDADRAGAQPVAIVNEAMARRYWPGASPLGRLLTIDTPRRIVGVVRDARFAALTSAATPQAFAPIAQVPVALNPLTLLVRSDASPAVTADWIRAEIRGLDPALPVTDISPFRDVIASQLFPQRAAAALLGLFGALSLLLAAFGIYAVVSYSVAQRTREVGIRMALGAQPSEVRTLVVRQSAAPLLAGLGAGLALAAASARLLGGLLYGVPPTDPGTFAAVTAVLLLGGLIAAYIPARRASRIDPIAAMRNE